MVSSSSSPPVCDEAWLNYLATCTIVEESDTFTMVTIPYAEDLSAYQREEVFNRAKQLQIVKALDSALRDITPPIDEEEAAEEGRQFEALARKELEKDGCPPCYPPGIDMSLRIVPREFQAIMDYWLWELRGDYLVLRAQLSDWQKFRLHQSVVRRRTRGFDAYLDNIRERRRSHGLGGHVHLLLDHDKQSQIENWIEFQNYHLMKLEDYETKSIKTRQELDNVRKLARNPNNSYSSCSRDVGTIESNLGYFEEHIKQAKILLHWIEQQRQEMDVAYQTSLQENSDDRAVFSKSSLNSRRKRIRNPSAVFSAKVTKRKQNTPARKPIRRLKCEATMQDLDNTPQALIINPADKISERRNPPGVIRKMRKRPLIEVDDSPRPNKRQTLPSFNHHLPRKRPAGLASKYCRNNPRRSERIAERERRSMGTRTHMVRKDK